LIKNVRDVNHIHYSHERKESQEGEAQVENDFIALNKGSHAQHTVRQEHQHHVIEVLSVSSLSDVRVNPAIED